LSDLVSARIGATTYLVGGYDGRTPRREILASRDGTHFTTVARLPVGLRYPALAVVSGKLLIAGGQTAGGLSRAIYSFDPESGTVRETGLLPRPLGEASGVVSGSTVYIVGGRTGGGAASGGVIAIRGSSVRTAAIAGIPIADSATATLGTTTFFIGGWDGRTLPSVLEAARR